MHTCSSSVSPPSVPQGVKIYDISTKQRITNVLRDDVSLRPDMYPCSLCWKDNQTLIVGWGKSIKVGTGGQGPGVQALGG